MEGNHQLSQGIHPFSIQQFMEGRYRKFKKYIPHEMENVRKILKIESAFQVLRRIFQNL